MLKRGFSLLLLALLAWAGWMAWQAPAISVGERPVMQSLPDRPGDAVELWRVVTRRMIVPKAADELGDSLRERGLAAIRVQHQEEVELHAFDDPRSFATREDALRVRAAWRKAGFEAELIRPDERFGVALGRLYMAAYAQQLQSRLQASGRPFTYHRRQLFISTWRFTFAPQPYAEAVKLWSKVQAMGVADPVLMRESRFVAMFGAATAAARAGD